MCLAIPGRIVEIVDEENHLAKVDVGGVRRNVNIGMFDKGEVTIGDYVLIHVGFAMSKIDEKEAAETLRLLQEIGEYETELDGFKSSLL
jgi:hydrogenase expression/formation protein HypC